MSYGTVKQIVALSLAAAACMAGGADFHGRAMPLERIWAENAKGDESAKTWRAVAWRNERVHGAFAVWGGDTNAEIRAEAEPLAGPGGATIPVRVRWVRETLASRFHFDTPRGKWDPAKYPLFPVGDVLDDAQPFFLTDRGFRGIWVSAKVPVDVPPGTYAGTLHVASGGEELAFPLSLEVLSATLPQRKRMYLDIWQTPWTIARYYGVKPFSLEHYARLEPIYRELADAGQRAITVTITDYPWNVRENIDTVRSMVKYVKRRDGSFVADFTLLDSYVAFAKKCGLGPQIHCYALVKFQQHDDYWYDDEATGKPTCVHCKPGSGEFKAYWAPLLRQLESHVADMGWKDDVYIALDELPRDDTAAAAALIRECAPSFKFQMAGSINPSHFKGIVIDNYSQGMHKPSFFTPEFFSEIAARRAAGLTTTVYVCCEPPRPNCLVLSPLVEQRWIGLFMAAKGLDGFLKSTSHRWTPSVDPLVDTSCLPHFPCGDSFLLYPGPRSSVRWESLRDGFEDYEKVAELRATGRLTPELAAALGKIDYTRFSGCDEAAVRMDVSAALSAIDAAAATIDNGIEHNGAFSIAAAFTNSAVIVSLDCRGRMSSLREKASGRELVAKAVPFVEGAVSLERRADALAFTLTGGGEVVLGVEAFGSLGWTFRIDSATPAEAGRRAFARLSPSCTNYVGQFANALSDDASFVVLRGYECDTAMECSADGLSVVAEGPRGPVGLRAGLAAGPRRLAIPALRAMTRAAGVPFSDLGGAWSLGAEGNRESYFFHHHFSHDVDALIDRVRRSGARTVNLYTWWEKLGRYEISRRNYPGGWSEFSNAVARLHSAGLKVSLHTLTGCIDTSDPWVTPVPSKHLIADIHYTLAAPVSPAAEELSVTVPPVRSAHDFVFTYAGRGNVLRIGDELVQYSGIDGNRFTGLRRGAFGTRAAAHRAGEACDYLHQIYRAFYPDPDSPLADEVADRIAAAYNGVRADQIYFDGSEGMGSRYAVDAMRRKIFSRLDQTGRPVLDEASHPGANNWWFHSRLGAWDSCYWAAKPFHDLHISRIVDQARKAEFIEAQLGWWYPKPFDSVSRGHFLDEAEYFASRNAGVDVAMSLQGLEAESGRLPTGQVSLITVIGWYERARLARAFAADVARRMAKPGAEFRLRQGEDGVWTVRDAYVRSHRVSGGVGAEWGEDFAADMDAAIRVEALFGAEPYGSANALAAFSPSDVGKAEKSAADGVEFSAGAAKDAERGDVVSLSAVNGTLTARGAWAGVVRRIPLPYGDFGDRPALGAWVKGDGSGALLNVQVTTPREYIEAYSEHYVRLDFKGWRYVTFQLRERDAEEYTRLVWPYGRLYQSVGRNRMDLHHVNGVGLWLNELPPGRRVNVSVGEVRALARIDTTVESPSVSVNGSVFCLPFCLASGDYAELENGRWTRYDRYGEPLAESSAQARPRVRKGRNDMVFSSASPDARVEVAISALGAKTPAFVSPLTEAMRREMEFEYMLPVRVAPAAGFAGEDVVAVRPGEKAVVHARTNGDARGAVLVLSDGSRDVRVALPGATPAIGGTWRYRVECADAKADFRLELVKRYESEGIVRTVQNAPGYNSWPMVHHVGRRLVCAYSRGSAHSIVEGARGVFARYSDDGGATWSDEVVVADDPKQCEVTAGKGNDEAGAMLLWVRCYRRGRFEHDLYRTIDGARFERVASPGLSPAPMQITDIVSVPGEGLMSLWFAGDYGRKEDGHSWGTLFSRDGGLSWTQRVVESGLAKSEWPTEPSAASLGGGRILAIARCEWSAKGMAQFQLCSEDGGKTWRKSKTNISDVCESTPSLVYDPESRTVRNYYYQRGPGLLKRRTAKVDDVIADPMSWPNPETIAIGGRDRPFDSGNVNATHVFGHDFAAWYSGNDHQAGVFLLGEKSRR